jgi:hypothetical protein
MARIKRVLLMMVGWLAALATLVRGQRSTPGGHGRASLARVPSVQLGCPWGRVPAGKRNSRGLYPSFPACFNRLMETTEKDLNYSNETLQVLKAIHAEQQKQGKYLRNIYQIQLIIFAAVLIAFTVALISGLAR